MYIKKTEKKAIFAKKVNKIKVENKQVNKIWPAGIKRTKQREQVLDILIKADKPLSAMEIYAQIEKATAPVWLSTVYRILDLFAEKAIVVKTTVMDNEIAVYELAGKQHKHYAVCICCHKMIPMANCPVKDFVPKLAESNFQITGHKLEMYGYCGECAAKKAE